MRKRRKYKQGIFNPKHPERYNGSMPCIYRSSYELKFCRWCDSNSNVLQWGSESVIIPYYFAKNGRPPKIHRYFVDYNLTLRDKEGREHKYLVEVKPFQQTQVPKPSPRKQKRTLMRENYTFALNNAKWTSARAWAKHNGYKFIIVTEKDLKIN